MSGLAAIQAALQDMAEAVSKGDAAAYRKAKGLAIVAGCTPEQMQDAYKYRLTLRGGMRYFDVDGNPV